MVFTKVTVLCQLTGVLVAGLIGSVSAHAVEPNVSRFSAKIYDRGNLTTPIFLYSSESTTEGSTRRSKNVFTTPDGSELAQENAEFENGKLKSYQQIQKQAGTDGRVEIRGNEAVFSLTKDGKTKTSSEKLKDNFVVGPSLIGYMQAHWSKLQNGESVDVRFAVIDRRETVGFTLMKVKDLDHKGQTAVAIRMKPTSFLIAALVDPLLFTLTADGKKLLELDGRIIPKRSVGGKLKDVDAVSVYEYP